MTDDPFDVIMDDGESSSAEGEGVTLDDFLAYMPAPSAFIYMPCREIWPGANVNMRLPRVETGKRVKGKMQTVAPTVWLAIHYR